jgi:leader peptidase (prepilin peptidase)/N-methyltransferase
MLMLPVLLAPFIGSFLGVLIRRLPQGQSVVWGRSRCEGCKSPLSAFDLVPLLSFVALRGRCRTCGARIAGFHLVVELAAIAVPAWVLCVETDPILVWTDCALGWTLLALAWIDLRHFVLPDVLTLPLLMAGLLATWMNEPDLLIGNAIGAAMGYLLFRAIELGYRAWRGKDGLGQGDAKLMAAAGAWVGWEALPQIMFGAAVAGIVLAVCRGGLRARDTLIPFGPCIALALWVVRLHGL